jgi:hypothetical protein
VTKDEITLLASLGLVGVFVGIGKLLVSEAPLTARQVVGRAITHGALGLCAGAAVVFVPGISVVAQVAIACVLASLGTSALEAVFNKWVKK